MIENHKNKLLGGTIALLGGTIILAASGIGPGAAAWGPRMVPTLAGIVMLVAGIAVAFEPMTAVDNGSSRLGQEMKALWLVLLAAAYVLAVGFVGYLAATFVAAPLLLLMFGTTSPEKLLGAALLSPAALHVFFFELLGIFPPRAAWFDLANLVGL